MEKDEELEKKQPEETSETDLVDEQGSLEEPKLPKEEDDTGTPDDTNEKHDDDEPVEKDNDAKKATESGDDPSSDKTIDELEEKISEPVTEDEIQVKELTAIESEEVDLTPDASVDPDKEISIVKPAAVVSRWRRPKTYIPIGIGLFVVILLAIPVTRYLAVGWIWHENVSLTVMDAAGKVPVSEAKVTLDNTTAVTDNTGRAQFNNMNVGYHHLRVQKQNYTAIDQTLAVEIFSSGRMQDIAFTATGKPVSLRVVDRLSGLPIADATVSNGASTYGKANKDGQVTVVIPVGKTELDATVAADGHRVLNTKITGATKQVELVADGSVYFLSKQSGKIDVVKTNLDGTDRKIVVAGTGNEDNRTTTLLAARDWKFLTLKSKRAPNKPESLYIVNADKDSFAALDEGNATFTPIGWSGHRFLYEVQRQTDKVWTAKGTALKSYNADDGKITVIDENASSEVKQLESAWYEQLGNYYIVDGALVYTKVWNYTGDIYGGFKYDGTHYDTVAKTLKSVIVKVKPDGTDHKDLKSVPALTSSYITSKLYAPQEIYFDVVPTDTKAKQTYASLENDGSFKDNITVDDFDSKEYPTYLVSPGGLATFWSEERDGKNALFVGDKNAGGKQELTAASEYKAYGWLTDSYLLLQKNDSELYITSKEQLKAGKEPLKVSDYHKVATSLFGYGYGYGGL